MSGFGTTTTLVMPVLVMGVHPAVLEIWSPKFWSAGQPSLLYSRKEIAVSLAEGNSLILTSLICPTLGFSGIGLQTIGVTPQVANSCCLAVLSPSVAVICITMSWYAQGPKTAPGWITVYGPTVILLEPSILQGFEIREQLSISISSGLPSASWSSIWLVRLPIILGQTIWMKWALFGIGGNSAWTAMLWSRSSVDRRIAHIVNGSVKGQLISIRVGEVREKSSWKERICQVYLTRVIRVKTKGREYWLDIAVPWRLVSVERDEHLHRENYDASYNGVSGCELPQAAQSMPTVSYYQSNNDS